MLQRVVRSTVVDAPIERVWAVLRDFNSHDRWHSAVAESRIEGGELPTQVGCVRSFRLQDGARIREQLLTLDDREHKSTYCIVEATVPLQRYVATVTLKPVTDGQRTFWHWESSFDTPPGQERALAEMVARGVYETGFADLQRHLASGADRREGGGLSVSQGPALPAALPLPTRSMTLLAYGEPSVMQPVMADAPAPGPGEVRIRQRAIGVNYFDIYLRRGWIPELLPLPGTPGMEAAGSVIDVGPGVSDFLPGDRVAYLGPLPGAYCTVRTVPAAWVTRLPPQVEDRTAAAVLLKGLTADMLVHDLGHVERGTRVLVHAAAGGVGLLVTSWAAQLGATVIGTVSTPEKARLARDFGCAHVIVTSNYQFGAEVQAQFGGADLIIDGLGEAARGQNFDALAPCGHWVSLGQASGGLSPISPDWLVQKSATFSRPVVFAWLARPGRLAERAQRLWAALGSGAVKLPPIEQATLEGVVQVHERMAARRTMGAQVLMV